MTTEIINQNHSMDMVMDADLSKVTQQLQAISNFQTVMQENLKSGQDFGLIPGTNKPTLLKPGAEKIQMLFGVTSEYEEIERIQDYDNGFSLIQSSVRCLKMDRRLLRAWDIATRKRKNISNKIHLLWLIPA